MRKGPEEMLTHEQMCPNWSAPDTSSSKLFLKGVFFFFLHDAEEVCQENILNWAKASYRLGTAG